MEQRLVHGGNAAPSGGVEATLGALGARQLHQARSHPNVLAAASANRRLLRFILGTFTALILKGHTCFRHGCSRRLIRGCADPALLARLMLYLPQVKSNPD